MTTSVAGHSGLSQEGNVGLPCPLGQPIATQHLFPPISSRNQSHNDMCYHHSEKSNISIQHLVKLLSVLAVVSVRIQRQILHRPCKNYVEATNHMLDKVMIMMIMMTTTMTAIHCKLLVMTSYIPGNTHLHCFPFLIVHPTMFKTSIVGTQHLSTAKHSSGLPQSQSSPSSTILFPQYEPLL